MRTIILPILLLAAGCQASPGTGKAETEAVCRTDSAVPEAAAFDLRRAVYVAEDSARVAALLADTSRTPDVLSYARCFLGKPYVAHTLEVADPEQLMVNLRQLDCTTLVETVLALTLTRRQGTDGSFEAFCRNLERLRYRGGSMDGYLSRLHYFTWWMHDAIDKGLMEEVCDKRFCTARINVRNYYMSQHPDRYKMLASHPERTDSIRRIEEAHNGPDGCYLPKSATRLGRDKLGFIHDGDLVAIVTSKAGLDYSHLGFAVWGKDGRLHLLNASSLHKKVVEEPMTLFEYLQRQKSAMGIRLLRLR